MKRRILIAAVAVLVVVGVAWAYSQYGWLFYRYHSGACKQRGKAYAVRVEKLKTEARARLRIGTHKEQVIRFFQENELPVSFDGDEYEGTVYLKGCAPAGCGSDDALLGLRVKVDNTGTVIADPVVGALYTNCL